MKDKDKKEKLNVNVLVTARNEYMSYLKKQLSKLVLEGFIEIYNDAVETQKRMESYEYIKQFQRFLRAVPEWNQTILVNETKRITSEIVYLQKLITAIFISEVKILTSIKLGGENKNFHIDIPPSDILIHKIYINLSATIYNSVDLLNKFKNINNNKINYNILRNIVEEGIEETIINLIPIKNILEEYLTIVLTDISRDGTLEDDSDSDDDKENENSKHNRFGSEQQLLDNVEQTINEFGTEGLEGLEGTQGPEGSVEQSVDFSNEFGNVTAADYSAETIKIGEPTTEPSGSGFGFGFGLDGPGPDPGPDPDFDTTPSDVISFGQEPVEPIEPVEESSLLKDFESAITGEVQEEVQEVQDGKFTPEGTNDFDSGPTDETGDNVNSDFSFGSSTQSISRSSSPDEFLQPESNDSFF